MTERVNKMGRPKKLDSEKRVMRKADEAAPKREVEARKNANRPPRRPLSTAYKLTLPEGIQEEGYQYRWLLDRPERIMTYEAAWWEKAKDGEGKPIRKPSGNGEWLTLYRIESKYFKEDQKENRKKAMQMLHDRARPTSESQATEYVPEGHEAVIKFS